MEILPKEWKLDELSHFLVSPLNDPHQFFSSPSKHIFQSINALRRIKKIPIFFSLGNLAFHRALNWFSAETQYSCLQFRSGFHFLLIANCTVKWLSHAYQLWNMQKYVKTVLAPWSLLCQQEKSGQHDDMWIAEVTGNGMLLCKKQTLCCEWTQWENRESTGKKGPPKGHRPCFCCTLT